MAAAAATNAVMLAPVILAAPFAAPVDEDPEAPVVFAAAPCTLVPVAEALVAGALAPEAEAAAVPPMGAVDWPSISA